MKPKHRAILKNENETPREIPRVRQAQACTACSGRGEVDDSDPYRDRDSRVSCKTCAGTGWLSGALLVFAILLLTLCSGLAATVTGTVRNRQGATVSTNILFKAVQRPLFDGTPSVLPGWTLTTNSASDGTFSTPLLAGNYQVTIGGELRDSFLILVPTNAASYEITSLVTNSAAYTWTSSLFGNGMVWWSNAVPRFIADGSAGQVLTFTAPGPRWQDSTGGGTSGIFTNIVYVNATGATALANGTLLTNAFKTALQYVRIVVGPGFYWTPDNTIPSTAFSSDNRVIEFEPGATWWNGSPTAAGSYMFDDIGGKVTNAHVIGRGIFAQTNILAASADILYLENGSNVKFEYLDATLESGGSIFSLGGTSNNLVFKSWGWSRSLGYDLCYFDVSGGNTVKAYFEEADSAGDFMEAIGDSPEWGLVHVHVEHGRAIEPGQVSFLQVGGRTRFSFGHIDVLRNYASLCSISTATNGIVEGGTIRMPAAAIKSLVQPYGNVNTTLWLKNVTSYLPAAMDILSLTNIAGTETTLENCNFFTGAGATNWARAITPSKVRIVGSLNINRTLPVSTGITIVGTNVLGSLHVMGAQTNAGAMTVAGQFTGSGMKVTGILDVDADVYANALIVSNIFIVPYAATTAGIEGSPVFDFDLFTSGRGALKNFDGTEDTVLVGVLASDTPVVGDTPRYTAAGVTTWEAPNSFTPSQISGVGGANTNFTIVLPAPESVINGFTNVSLRAVMNTDAAKAYYWSLLITNGGGSDRTLEFSAVTNRWRFSGTYGTNAPSTLTNATQLLISGRSLGTNTIVGYTYFPWP